MGVVLVEIDLKIGDLSDFKLVEFFLMFFIEYFYVISDYVVVFQLDVESLVVVFINFYKELIVVEILVSSIFINFGISLKLFSINLEGVIFLFFDD